MKILVFSILLFSLSTQAAWDLNDVSYLMPLPAELQTNKLLGVQSAGNGGPLLPQEIVMRVPHLTMGMTREEAASALRVLAVRVDPCFPLPTPQSCQKQIRLVWQPLELDRKNQVRAVDAAIHSFYVLSDSEFSDLLKDLNQWKNLFAVNTSRLPLQVHPAWQAQGDSSPALAQFQQILTRYAGQKNLRRVTVMVLRGAGDMWAFAGFDVHAGRLQSFPVPRLGSKLSQSFVNLAVPSDFFTGGGIAPAPQTSDTLNKIVAESEITDEKFEDTIREEIRAAYRIENPKNYTPENMDCVSCHVTQAAIHWALDTKPLLKLDQLWSREIYQNANYNLANNTQDIRNTQIIRGFGYFGRSLAISQRVINESAEVADQLNLLPKSLTSPRPTSK